MADHIHVSGAIGNDRGGINPITVGTDRVVCGSDRALGAINGDYGGAGGLMETIAFDEHFTLIKANAIGLELVEDSSVAFTAELGGGQGIGLHVAADHHGVAVIAGVLAIYAVGAGTGAAVVVGAIANAERLRSNSEYEWRRAGNREVAIAEAGGAGIRSNQYPIGVAAAAGGGMHFDGAAHGRGDLE